MIQNDKTQHATWGNNIFLFFLVVFYEIVWYFNSLASYRLLGDIVAASLTMVFIIGIGKEVQDYFDPENHTADIFDAIWTVWQPTLYAVLYFTTKGIYG